MSSAMVGNGYQQNYNTYNGQPAPNQGQNVQDGYHEPHPSSRPPANEQQYYSSSPSQPQSVQKEQNPSPRRMPTPPHGLDIVSQSERTRQAREKQRQYGQELQKENIPDIHLESYRKNPFEENRRGERNREYNEFLSQKEVKAQSKREQIDNLRRQPAVQPKFDKYASSDSHQQHRKQLESELRDQYQSFLSQKKKGEVPRRQGDPSMDEKNMFSDLGKSQDAHKKKIHENAKQDYRNYVDHDSWYDAQPPTHRRSPPRDYRPDQENHQRHNHDAYAERLDQARANEALYRKHDHQMNDHGHRQPPPSQAQAPYALY